MKIAQIHPYPPEINGQIPHLPGNATQGGGETSSFRFAQKLSEHGHTVTYYAGNYPGIKKKELLLSKKFRVKYVDLLLFQNMGPAISLELFIDLLKNKYDVIQSHQIPIMFSVISGIVAKIQRKKFIMTFHGRTYGIFIDYIIAQIASFLSDAITVQNKFSYDLVSHFVDEKKLVIIPHGVDTKLFYERQKNKDLEKRYHIKKSDNVLLFIGRLLPAKGVDVLLEATEKLIKTHSVKVLIVGEGPEKDFLQSYAQKLGIQNHIIFTGLIKQDALPDYYSLSNVFVLPSVTIDRFGNEIKNVSENFGNVLVESMSCKTPIVASRVGGIPDWVIEGKNGLLFEARNSKDLANQIEKLLQNATFRKQIIENAYSDIQTTYSWDVVIQSFEKLYR